MLEKLYAHPNAAPRLRASPLGPWLDTFVGSLAERGYTTWSIRSNVVLAADLGRWIAARGVSVESLDEAAINSYLAHRRTQRERRRATALLMLGHLRVEGVAAPRPVVSDSSGIAIQTQRYAAYMRSVRGAAEGTIEGYVSVAREFLDRRFGSGDVELLSLTASDVAAFLRARAPELSIKRVAYLVSALRSFLRFLFARGETATDLSTPPLMPQARYRAAIPQYLSPAEVERLLATAEPSTPAGRRNRAILVLLVRLGLRASEVAALELDDLRWRTGEVVVRGKGNVVDRLPLLSEVGRALSAYLANDRPATTASRRVFLRLCAPVRELGGRGAVSSVVRGGLKRAGLRPQARGAHLLRHTLATQMIRGGASMVEIAEVLRHRSPRSSAIYAKVDFEALRVLAQPWPFVGGSR
jgi:site-specific recombinase XerD